MSFRIRLSRVLTAEASADNEAGSLGVVQIAHSSLDKSERSFLRTKRTYLGPWFITRHFDTQVDIQTEVYEIIQRMQNRRGEKVNRRKEIHVNSG